MKISCVVVSYNNGEQLKEAVISVVEQTRPADEIIIADDASTDESRQVIDALSLNHANIRPIFRERNLGVSANRDLAVREALGDLVTCLDGDDYYLPTKIEAESRVLHGRADGIAYSDFRLVDRGDKGIQEATIAEFATLGASERIKWLLKRSGWSPSAMLVPKKVHLRIGGYNHSLRTWEDWDYSLRLAAQPVEWAHSGTVGHVLHIGAGGGLSNQRSVEHMRDELRVLRLNSSVARRHVGVPFLLATAGKVVVFRSKWVIVPWYRRMKGRFR